MTPEERKALDDLDIKKAEIVKKSFWLCQTFLRMNEENLKHAGHENLGAALTCTIRDADTRINALITEHIKKFP